MIGNTQKPSATGRSVAARLGLMACAVAGLVAGSSRTRRMPPGERFTVAVNTSFFVALGALDESVLGASLATQPLLRTAVLVAETLALGWWFSPGGAKPASRTLFYVHIAPFFGAVLGGAAATHIVHRWRAR
jgi:hypothetical protein